MDFVFYDPYQPNGFGRAIGAMKVALTPHSGFYKPESMRDNRAYSHSHGGAFPA